MGCVVPRAPRTGPGGVGRRPAGPGPTPFGARRAFGRLRWFVGAWRFGVMAPTLEKQGSLMTLGAKKLGNHYGKYADVDEAGVSESDDEKHEKQLTTMQLMFEEDPEEAQGVVDDGVTSRLAAVRPVFLRITVVDGVLARVKAGDDAACAYPIARHRIVAAVSRTSVFDPALRMPVRWYRVNPARKDKDSQYSRGAGKG